MIYAWNHSNGQSETQWRMLTEFYVCPPIVFRRAQGYPIGGVWVKTWNSDPLRTMLEFPAR
jgi:hypothetical protein